MVRTKHEAVIDVLPPFPGPIANVDAPQKRKYSRDPSDPAQDDFLLGSHIIVLVEEEMVQIVQVVRKFGGSRGRAGLGFVCLFVFLFEFVVDYCAIASLNEWSIFEVSHCIL